MRLIDADACIDYIRTNNQHAWEALAYAPTIDAIEIVRCKDCKNRARYAVCDFLGEDGFCSHGERREDGEDYELATEQMEHDAMYEPTYNSEDGSM